MKGAADESMLGSTLAVEVVDAVLALEEGSEAAAFGEALAKADLVGVGVDDDVGAAVAGDGEEGHRLIGLVVDLVGTLFAYREVEHLALFELAGAGEGSEGWLAGEDDHQLLVRIVEVVRVGGLSRRQLPLATADQLGP